MKKEKKDFLILRSKVIKYNKIFIGILVLFIIYALIHSVAILDCNDTFTAIGEGSVGSCTNVPNDLFKFMNDNYMIISVILLLAAIVVLVLQKIQLYKINQIDINLLEEEKVNKTSQIIITLLLGYTGAHKFRTENKAVGSIYLTNFIVFAVTWIIKTFSNKTYYDYSIIRIAYEFSVLFIIGIIILNVIEAIFSLLSEKDDDDMIFA